MFRPLWAGLLAQVPVWSRLPLPGRHLEPSCQRAGRPVSHKNGVCLLVHRRRAPALPAPQLASSQNATSPNSNSRKAVLRVDRPPVLTAAAHALWSVPTRTQPQPAAPPGPVCAEEEAQLAWLLGRGQSFWDRLSGGWSLRPPGHRGKVGKHNPLQRGRLPASLR